MATYPTEACPAPNCARRVIWAVTDKMAHVCVDADPRPDGNVTLTTVGRTVRATVHRNPGRMFGKTIYTQHSNVCPAGNRYTKAGPKRLENT